MPDALRDTIRALETALHDPAVRSSAARLDALLSDDFVEFGSSGRVWTKRDAVEQLPRSSPARFVVRDFDVRELSDSIVLATYRVEKSVDGAASVASLRSSLWRRTDGRWQMVFHQGTLVTQRSA